MFGQGWMRGAGPIPDSLRHLRCTLLQTVIMWDYLGRQPATSAACAVASWWRAATIWARFFVQDGGIGEIDSVCRIRRGR